MRSPAIGDTHWLVFNNWYRQRFLRRVALVSPVTKQLMDQRNACRPGIGKVKCRINPRELEAHLSSVVNRAHRLLIIPVGLLLLILSLAAAHYRFIDADEGFYLLASRLVLQHKVPYVDFLYTQAPLLPYIYGLWMRVFEESWPSARALSACLTTALGILLYVHIGVRTRKSVIALHGVLLFAGTTLIFAWMPIVKTYALSSLLLFASYMLVTRAQPRFPPGTLLFAGLLLGVGIEVRSYLAGLVPIFLFWLYRRSRPTAKHGRVLWFVGGLSLAATPAAVLLAMYPSAFIFNNIGIHAIRSGSGLVGGFGQKAVIAAQALIAGPRENGLQLGMLFLLGLFLLRNRKMAEPEQLAFLLAAALGLICLAPTPSYVQYFCVTVPFLLAATLSSFGNLPLAGNRKERKRLIAGICLGTLFYLAPTMADCRKYFISGESLNGIYRNKDPEDWTLATVRAVSRGVDELAVPGERVMSFWPGYIIGSKATPYPGFESDCGRIFAGALSAEQLSKFHIVSGANIEAEIDARAPRIVVVGNQEYWSESRRRYVAALERSGYGIARQVRNTSIYVRTEIRRSASEPPTQP